MLGQSPSTRHQDPLFGLTPTAFTWATGIEDTFVAQTDRIGERVLDEYALTNHYSFWREDLDRVSAVGLGAMRYGIPWYKVEPSPGKFDWSWTDKVIEYAASKQIHLIADLMHYGTPLWLDNQFLNSSYPQRVAEYEAEFAGRYRSVITHYTPLNEPLITMDFCGEKGLWPPYLRGHDGSVKILRQIARGIAMSVDAIRQADPNAVIVHVEAAGEYIPDNEQLQPFADFLTSRARAATDLILGKVGDRHPLFSWLLDHGMSEDDLAWHRQHPTRIDVMGDNYYPEVSVYRVRDFNGTPGTERIWGGAEGLIRSVRDFHSHFGLPVFISETSTNGDLELRSKWMKDSIATIPLLRSEGVPVVGYTWWPLFSLIDWVYRDSARPVEGFIGRNGPPVLDTEYIAKSIKGMRWNRLEQLPLEAYVATMGLYEIDMQFDGTFARTETPLVGQFRDYVKQNPGFLGPVGKSG